MDAGPEGTYTSIHGSSSAVVQNSSGGGAGVYIAQQLQDGVSNARPNHSSDTGGGGVYRPSSYGLRAPTPKTGLHSLSVLLLLSILAKRLAGKIVSK